jgi:hypothetical protein
MGIGVNTAIFSIANTILLQPPPIKDADRIVDVHSIPTRRISRLFSYPDYLELRKRTGAEVDLFATSPAVLALGTSGVGKKGTVDSEAEELR